MADRAIIRISAIPDSDLRRALTGTVDGMRKASRQVASEEARARKAADQGAKRAADTQAREAKKAADAAIRETKRAAQEAERAAQKSAAAQEREVKRVEREKRREIEKTLRDAEKAARGQIREAQKTARGQIREAERATRAQQKAAKEAGEQRRAMMLALAAGAYGAAKGVAGLAARGQGLAGVGSLEERLSTSGDFRAQLIRTAGEAKVSPEERARVEANLLKVSEETNVSLMDLVAGLTTAQQRFDQFGEFSATIGDVAKVSQATGESMQDLVGAIGTATKVFQLDEAGQRDFINALIATSERGSINVGNMSRDFAASMGTFQVNARRTGPEAAREFLAASQVFGTSQAGAAESATMLERFMSVLALPTTQAKLRSIGIDVTGTDGQLKNVGEIGALFAGSKRFQEAGVRQAIFPELEARQGAQFMMAEIARNPQAFTALQDIDAAEGRASIDRRRKELAADPTFRLRNIGIRAQTATVRDADRIVTAITPAVTELTKLQLQFPLLTESLDTLERTVQWAVGTLIAERFIRGGSAFGAQAGEALGRTASVSLGKAFSEAGWAGKVGMAGQVMATAFLSFMTTQQILQSTGWDKAIESLGSKLYEWIYGGPKKSEGRGFGPGKSQVQLDKEREVEAAQRPIDFPVTLGPGPAYNPDAVPSPMIPPAGAEAKLVIEVIGPGKVKSVSTVNTDVTIPNTGNRGITP